MGLGHNSIAWKLLTGAAAGDALLHNAVAGVTVASYMFFHTALAAAFYVSWARATVKTAFAEQFRNHSLPLSQNVPYIIPSKSALAVELLRVGSIVALPRYRGKASLTFHSP